MGFSCNLAEGTSIEPLIRSSFDLEPLVVQQRQTVGIRAPGPNQWTKFKPELRRFRRPSRIFSGSLDSAMSSSLSWHTNSTAAVLLAPETLA